MLLWRYPTFSRETYTTVEQLRRWCPGPPGMQQQLTGSLPWCPGRQTTTPTPSSSHHRSSYPLRGTAAPLLAKCHLSPPLCSPPPLTPTSPLTHFAARPSATATTNAFSHLPQLAGWLLICFSLRLGLTSPSSTGPWHRCRRPSSSASNNACCPPLTLHVPVSFPRPPPQSNIRQCHRPPYFHPPFHHRRFRILRQPCHHPCRRDNDGHRAHLKLKRRSSSWGSAKSSGRGESITQMTRTRTTTKTITHRCHHCK